MGLGEMNAMDAFVAVKRKSNKMMCRLTNREPLYDFVESTSEC